MEKEYKRLTVAEYARLVNQPKHRIYQRIEDDLKDMVIIEGGVKYIRIEETSPAPIEEYRAEVQGGIVLGIEPPEASTEPERTGTELEQAQRRIAELEKALEESQQDAKKAREEAMEILQRAMDMTEKAQELTHQAQLLSAKSQQLLESGSNNKLPWYKRLFSKNNG